jgi:hypothetical protein
MNAIHNCTIHPWRPCTSTKTKRVQILYIIITAPPLVIIVIMYWRVGGSMASRLKISLVPLEFSMPYWMC